jgi:hypothetical protein
LFQKGGGWVVVSVERRRAAGGEWQANQSLRLSEGGQQRPSVCRDARAVWRTIEARAPRRAGGPGGRSKRRRSQSSLSLTREQQRQKERRGRGKQATHFSVMLMGGGWRGSRSAAAAWALRGKAGLDTERGRRDAEKVCVGGDPHARASLGLFVLARLVWQRFVCSRLASFALAIGGPATLFCFLVARRRGARATRLGSDVLPLSKRSS